MRLKFIPNMISFCRTINYRRFLLCGDFDIAFSAMILIFADLGKQIPNVIAAGRTINHYWAFFCADYFTAFAAVVYIFSDTSEVDPDVISLCWAISDIRFAAFCNRHITFSAEIYICGIDAAGTAASDNTKQ